MRKQARRSGGDVCLGSQSGATVGDTHEDQAETVDGHAMSDHDVTTDQIRVTEQDTLIQEITRQIDEVTTKLHDAPRAYRDDGTRGLLARTLSFVGRTISPEVTVREINGVICEFDFESSMYLGDLSDERDVIASFMNDLRDGDVVYDIGSNVGVFSAFAGQKLGENVRVVAFEPNPIAASLLYSNLRLNCEDFDAFSIAVSDGEGFGRIQASFATGGDIVQEVGLRVRTDTICRLVESGTLAAPTAVKVDVEGAELAVLEGLGDLLEDVEVLYVEVHKEKGRKFDSDESAVRSLLEDHFESVVELGSQRRGVGVQKHLRATSGDR